MRLDRPTVPLNSTVWSTQPDMDRSSSIRALGRIGLIQVGETHRLVGQLLIEPGYRLSRLIASAHGDIPEADMLSSSLYSHRTSVGRPPL